MADNYINNYLRRLDKATMLRDMLLSDIISEIPWCEKWLKIALEHDISTRRVNSFSEQYVRYKWLVRFLENYSGFIHTFMNYDEYRSRPEIDQYAFYISEEIIDMLIWEYRKHRKPGQFFNAFRMIKVDITNVQCLYDPEYYKGLYTVYDHMLYEDYLEENVS